MLIAFHGNNGYANTHECYIIPILPVLFSSQQEAGTYKLEV